ncbi:hypothetical protein J2W96_002307 [Variovorax guangxiensis]|nr:hypothetical protein [Variovorax guangxiensis]
MRIPRPASMIRAALGTIFNGGVLGFISSAGGNAALELGVRH